MRALLAALSVALSGCCLPLLPCLADMEVRARNHTPASIEVHVWINHTGEPAWHRWVSVPPGGEAVLGTFQGPARNDYSMLAIAGGLRAERTAQQLGDSYPSWTLEVHADHVRDVLLVY